MTDRIVTFALAMDVQTSQRWRRTTLKLLGACLAISLICLTGYRIYSYTKMSHLFPPSTTSLTKVSAFVGFPPPLNDTARLEAIRQMAREAWATYRRDAWGADALGSCDQSSGMLLLEAVSTLYILDLKEEYEEGRQWIAQYSLPSISSFAVAPMVTRVLGCFESLYALTGDLMYWKKVLMIAKAVEKAFKNADGRPSLEINPFVDLGHGLMEKIGDIGGMQLELRYLHALTNNSYWNTAVGRLRHRLKQKNGLYRLTVESYSVLPDPEKYHFSLQSSSVAFFASLVKSYIQSGSVDQEAKQMFESAIDAAKNRKMLVQRDDDGLVFIQDYNVNTHSVDGLMGHEACAYGAILKLTGYDALAEGITETCYKLTSGSETGLPLKQMDMTTWTGRQYYRQGVLSPHLAESYLTLFRTTQSLKYRNYAWELFKAINTSARASSGTFSEIGDRELNPDHYCTPPEFLGATLKYLFLAFTDLTVLSMDKWVFNVIGQPMPICGSNPLFVVLTHLKDKVFVFKACDYPAIRPRYRCDSTERCVLHWDSSLPMLQPALTHTRASDSGENGSKGLSPR